MRPVLPLLLALFAVLPAGARADASRVVDPSRQNTELAPGADNTDNRMAPGNADNQVPFKRDERVQNSRFSTPDMFDKKMAPDAGRRAPFDVTETREKNIIDRKEFPTPEIQERKLSPDNREMFHVQPGGDMDKKYSLVSKYQSRMTDASAAAAQRAPTFEKRTTFDKINRFVFHRNGPGENGNAIVTQAGGGTTSTVSGGNVKTQSVQPPQAPPPSK